MSFFTHSRTLNINVDVKILSLNFLDWIFGTAYYPKEGIPEKFGSDKYSNNIIVQHYQPFLDCYKIAKKDGWFALLRKPKRDMVNQQPVTEN